MNIECSIETLAEGIHRTERIAQKHMTLPVLSCLFFEAKKNNTLTIKSTNLDLGIEISIPAKVETEGTLAIPASVISSFISGIHGDEKTIKLSTNEATPGNLSISTKNTTGTIKTMPPDEFPNIPKIIDGKSFTATADEFTKGLKAVWYSASVSGIKPELSSVYIYCEGQYIVFAATDSFRLAEKKVLVKKDKDFGQILIPFKNIPEIIKILDGVREEITVELNKNQISFNFHGVHLISRVIDGVFPDYGQIIPKDFKTEVVVLKQDFINSLKLSHIFSDKFNQVNFKILPSKKMFEIKTKNNDIGETVQKIDAAITGDDVEINFNYRYIVDCFQSIDADSISLHFSGLNRPLIIRPVSDSSFTYLVMPMNR
jgi:DNA polymerase-3 subunit beta